MKQEKSCGAVVFSIDGKSIEFLLLKHVNGGHWSFPKGHVEEGETETQTALREIFEETGLDVKIIDHFRYKISYSLGSDVYKDVIYFAALSGNQKVECQASEIDEYRWVKFDEAVSLLTYENTRQVLREAMNYIKNHPDSIFGV